MNLAVLGTLTAAGGKTSAAFFLRCDDRARDVGSGGFTGPFCGRTSKTSVAMTRRGKSAPSRRTSIGRHLGICVEPGCQRFEGLSVYAALVDPLEQMLKKRSRDVFALNLWHQEPA